MPRREGIPVNPLAWLPSLPETPDHFAAWSVFLSLTYFGAREAAQAIHHRQKDALSVTGDAIRFSQSVLVLLAATHSETIMKTIGNLVPWLLYAGLAGLIHTIRGLAR